MSDFSRRLKSRVKSWSCSSLSISVFRSLHLSRRALNELSFVSMEDRFSSDICFFPVRGHTPVLRVAAFSRLCLPRGCRNWLPGSAHQGDLWQLYHHLLPLSMLFRMPCHILGDRERGARAMWKAGCYLVKLAAKGRVRTHSDTTQKGKDDPGMRQCRAQGPSQTWTEEPDA